MIDVTRAHIDSDPAFARGDDARLVLVRIGEDTPSSGFVKQAEVAA
jgi:hypothetical protein